MLMIQSLILWILVAAAVYLAFQEIHDRRGMSAAFLIMGALLLSIAAGYSCSHHWERQHKTIAAQHAGHETMHAQIEKDLIGAEPGDILERLGEHRMFVTQRYTGKSIRARLIFSNSDWLTLYHSDLILAHAKIIKFGTPEHAAALEAEAADTFSYYHRKPQGRRFP